MSDVRRRGLGHPAALLAVVLAVTPTVVAVSPHNNPDATHTGSSGNSNGPHLHFDMRIGDDFIDPAKFLADHDVPM